MNAQIVKLLVVTLALVSAPVLAQDAAPRARGQGWSMLAHQTVGGGSTALGVQVGFPGLTIGVLHGVQSGFDLGGRVSLNYAYEGMVRLIHPGVKAELVGRLKLLEGPRLGLGFHFGAGFLSTFAPGVTVYGMSLPVGLVAGIPIGSALMVNIGVDLPLFVTFGTFGGLTAPILAGAGLEYFIDRSLLISFNTRMGPALNPTVLRISTPAEFAFQAQVGVALKL